MMKCRRCAETDPHGSDCSEDHGDSTVAGVDEAIDDPAVQVPRAQVVEKTVEGPQLQIVEQIVETPETQTTQDSDL